MHLARIASIEGRREAMDTLMRRLLALGTADRSAGDPRLPRLRPGRPGRVEARHPRADGQSARRPRGDRAPGGDLSGRRGRRRALRDTPHRLPILGRRAGAWPTDCWPGWPWREGAGARRGRSSTRAGRFDPIAELELRSLLAVLPFLQLPRAELLEIRRRVEAWPARVEGPGEPSHSAAHTGLHPYVRLYRLGLLDASLGDTTAALRFAASLEWRERLGERLEGGRAPHLRTEHSGPSRRGGRPRRPRRSSSSSGRAVGRGGIHLRGRGARPLLPRRAAVRARPTCGGARLVPDHRRARHLRAGVRRTGAMAPRAGCTAGGRPGAGGRRLSTVARLWGDADPPLARPRRRRHGALEPTTRAARPGNRDALPSRLGGGW